MKDKKTLWFSSQAASMSKSIIWSWQVLQCTRERGWTMVKLSRKVSKISPEKATAQKAVACALQQTWLWDVCDVTAVQLPKCFQPVLWWESNMTLWWKQSVLQSHAGSKANAASAGFFNWSHTEAKGMYKNKRKDYFCLNKKPLGFHWVCSPWKTFWWEKLSLGLMNFNLSVR